MTNAYQANADSIIQETEKAEVFLETVVGLDLGQYEVQVKVPKFVPPTNYDKAIKFTLTAGDRKLDIICYFRNNSLVWCKLYPINGSLLLNKPAALDALEEAKGILARCQSFSSTSYMTTMVNMLNKTEKLDSNKTTTSIEGNVIQTISTDGDYQSFKWDLYENGIKNDYNTVVIALRNGFFEFFRDNWGLYRTGSLEVAFSEQEAISLAKEHFKNYTWTVGDQTVSAPTTAIVEDQIRASVSMQDRGNLTLYPLWTVKLPLNEVYLGMVTWIQVSFWADNGDLTYISALGGYGNSASTPTLSPSPTIDPTLEPTQTATPTNDDNQTVDLTPILALSGIVVIAIAVGALVYLKRRKG